MIKFIICEDNLDTLERKSQTVTKSMMKYDMEYKVYKFPKYTNELKKLINENGDVKIYILDVELPGISGLEIASEIREDDDDSIIIFATAHPDYRDDIFYSRLSAIDYIPKQQRYQERLQDTIKHIMTKIYRNKCLVYSFNHVYNRLLLKEIDYVEKSPEQNKCIIHLTNGKEKYIVSSLTKLEEEFKPLFFKTHKSCIVNLSNIKYIEFSKYIIHFKSGKSTDLLTISARKELKEYVGNL